ncbi:hypothetical protein GMA10_12530 [Kocuria koreensis]|jgi:hypothetical protein|uniref:Uncharacterized protein n=1 Tax=Rothia koreensis TaxID=592378 RepID=A0A7M3SW59_9MICC|nr:hypothetical protein [Rothia koreensis]MUN56024.1 hypothetical protein [Rothia koreensis]
MGSYRDTEETLVYQPQTFSVIERDNGFAGNMPIVDTNKLIATAQQITIQFFDRCPFRRGRHLISRILKIALPPRHFGFGQVAPVHRETGTHRDAAQRRGRNPPAPQGGEDVKVSPLAR